MGGRREGGIVSDDEIIAALGSSEFFKDLPPKQLKAIAKAGRVMAFPPGADLVFENDEAAGRYFLILDGSAEVTVQGQSKATLGPGASVGELALLDGGPRSATVTAVSGVRTFSLTSWNFRPFLREPDVLNAVIGLLCRRLRAADAASSGAKT